MSASLCHCCWVFRGDGLSVLCGVRALLPGFDRSCRSGLGRGGPTVSPRSQYRVFVPAVVVLGPLSMGPSLSVSTEGNALLLLGWEQGQVPGCMGVGDCPGSQPLVPCAAPSVISAV